jgi:hypothetical protein
VEMAPNRRSEPKNVTARPRNPPTASIHPGVTPRSRSRAAMCSFTTSAIVGFLRTGSARVSFSLAAARLLAALAPYQTIDLADILSIALGAPPDSWNVPIGERVALGEYLERRHRELQDSVLSQQP